MPTCTAIFREFTIWHLVDEPEHAIACEDNTHIYKEQRYTAIICARNKHMHPL